jgi:hypothetical protein
VDAVSRPVATFLLNGLWQVALIAGMALGACGGSVPGSCAGAVPSHPLGSRACRCCGASASESPAFGNAPRQRNVRTWRGRAAFRGGFRPASGQFLANRQILVQTHHTEWHSASAALGAGPACTLCGVPRHSDRQARPRLGSRPPDRPPRIVVRCSRAHLRSR